MNHDRRATTRCWAGKRIEIDHAADIARLERVGKVGLTKRQGEP